MPELTHIHIFFLFILLRNLILSEHFSQLSNSQFIQLQFLLLFPQNKHFLFLLNSLLIQLQINNLNFLLPLLFTLLLLMFQLLDLLFECLYHVFSYSLYMWLLRLLWGFLQLFGFFFVHGEFLFDLLELLEFVDVDSVLFFEYTLLLLGF